MDLEQDIGNDNWESIMKNTLNILCCNTDGEMQFKILQRLHYTPLLRSKLGLGSPLCIMCDTEVGTFSHDLEVYKVTAVLGKM